VWQTYTVTINPFWTDAQASAAGWIKDDSPVQSFANTMSDVYRPEIRLQGSGYMLAGIDNFSLTGGPCPNDYPCNMTNLDTFLTNECGNYFNPIGEPIAEVCEPITELDFEGPWYIAAIARETVNHLRVEWRDPSKSVAFDTEDCSTWGLFGVIDFEHNLWFMNLTAETEYPLDPFLMSENRFRVCRLTQNSNQLGYLTNPTTLFAGDLIIGFEDYVPGGDLDDIVLVARPAVEPEPAEPVARSKGFKTKTVEFDLLFDAKGNSYDVDCLAPVTCSVVTFQKLEDLPSFDEMNLKHVPFNLPWGASESPGCVYVRTRSGGVKKVCE